MILTDSDPQYRQCVLSVMDNIADPDIRFDAKGVCNYYYDYLDAEGRYVQKGEAGKREFDRIVEQIKKDGRGKRYDCILGVSGGVDSSYLAYLAREAGLRVLCIHFDNGWNSELAVMNIENIVAQCGWELYTYVINWPEFRDIQLSYFKAHVIDIEAVTDIAIFSALDLLCRRFGVKHLLDGRNVVTEITLPPSWICKSPSNLRDIHRRFGTLPLKSYPLMGPIRRRVLARTKPFRSWPLLNYADYDKKEAKKVISEKLQWRDYGGKHYESVFTRFYQGYILPQKFHVDKRKAHLSNMIFSGQISREEAVKELRQPRYPPGLLERDTEFVIKKLGITPESLQAYLRVPPVAHAEFDLSISLFDEVAWLKPFRRVLEARGGGFSRRSGTKAVAESSCHGK